MTALSLFLSVFISLGAVQTGDGFYTLAYHTFMGDKNQFSFSLQELDQHCDYLQKNGFTFISYDDIVQGRVKGRKNVLVTIDDGHRTVLDAYYKVLKKYRIRPLLGIYPNIIEKKDYAMTWDQVRQLVREGCTIAAHGYFHSFVNEKLYRKNKKAFMNEIYKSKARLEEKLGITVTAFVFPFGVRSPITIKTLREAGYRHAFTINNGFMSVPMQAGDTSLEIPRYMLTRSFNQSVLARINRKSSKKNVIVEKEPTVPRKHRLTKRDMPREYSFNDAKNPAPLEAPLVDEKSFTGTDLPAASHSSLSAPEIKKEIVDHIPGRDFLNSYFRDNGHKPSLKVKVKDFYSSLYLKIYRYYSAYVSLINSKIMAFEKKVWRFFKDTDERKTSMLQPVQVD